MRRRLLAIVALLAPSFSLAGVGVWTASSLPHPGNGAVVGQDGTVYAGCGENFCKSADHGHTWQDLAGPGDLDLVPLAVDPSGVIYANAMGTGEATVSSTLVASRDGGNTWTSLTPPMFATPSISLSVDPFSAGTLFLLTVFGALSRSTDAGAHWTDIGPPTSPLSSVFAIAFDSNVSGRVYAAGGSVVLQPGISSEFTLFASNDDGSTWTVLGTYLPAAFGTLVVDPFRSSTIDAGGGRGVFRSDDGGRSFAAQSASAVSQIVADPIHPGRLYAATPANGVLRSVDGGTTWIPLNAGLTSLEVDQLALDPPAGILYAVTGAGPFVNRLPDSGSLLLNAVHPFTVSLSAIDPHTGATAPGVATQVNDLWGYFSIPAITGNPNNPEVFVKLLDGTAINGEYWFFYGGLTNLEYTVTVTDATTGASKTYTKPAGSECGGSDTAAFTP